MRGWFPLVPYGQPHTMSSTYCHRAPPSSLSCPVCSVLVLTRFFPPLYSFLGDSSNGKRDGKDPLYVAIRSQGNFLETVPLALTIALLAELNGADRYVFWRHFSSLILFPPSVYIVCQLLSTHLFRLPSSTRNALYLQPLTM
jgi:hypothetical protein